MLEASPILEYRLTGHVRLQMKRRGIAKAEVEQVLLSPERAAAVRPGRVVYESRVEGGDPAKTHLIRVFVDVDRHPPAVVTAYRTSKISRYLGD